MKDWKNTSGQGMDAEIPEEIRGYNWGAFFLGLIWAKMNGIPVGRGGLFNPFLNFQLASSGNELAWKFKRWESVAHFRRVQRRFVYAPLILWTGFILLLFSSVYLIGSPMVGKGLTYIRNHPEAIRALGEPIEKEYTENIKKQYNKGGTARFAIRGSKTTAMAVLKTRMENGQEVIDSLLLELKNGKTLTLAP